MHYPSKCKLGLLGHRISYSLSPIIHQASAASLGIELDYQVLDVPASEVEQALSRFWEEGGIGLNVTSPYKSAVVPFVAQSDGLSLNTLYRGRDGWHGTSTDGEGFTLALARNERELSHVSRMIILGSGGAAQAIVREVKRQRPHLAVTIVRRDASRDGTFAEYSDLELVDWSAKAIHGLCADTDGMTMLVQATSAPHSGDDMSPLLPALELFRGLLVDLCYRPSSVLLKAYQARGGWGIDGLDMLIEQARLSQELWFGKAAPYSIIREALESHIKAR